MPVQDGVGHQRCAHPRGAADHPLALDQQRARCSSSRISGGPRRASSTRRCRSRRWRRACRSCSASRCRCARTGSTGSTAQPGSAVLCENVRFNKGEKKDDEALARRMAGAVRRVRHGCLRHRASGRGQHPRRGELRASGLRGAAAGGRARGARARAREAGAAAGGDRRRLEGVDQAHGARVAARQGRQADRRRRHRQHLPGRDRRGGRQVAVRDGDARRRAPRSCTQARERGAEIPLPIDVVVAQGIRRHRARRRAAGARGAPTTR